MFRKSFFVMGYFLPWYYIIVLFYLSGHVTDSVSQTDCRKIRQFLNTSVKWIASWRQEKAQSQQRMSSLPMPTAVESFFCNLVDFLDSSLFACQILQGDASFTQRQFLRPGCHLNEFQGIRLNFYHVSLSHSERKKKKKILIHICDLNFLAMK